MNHGLSRRTALALPLVAGLAQRAVAQTSETAVPSPRA